MENTIKLRLHRLPQEGKIYVRLLNREHVFYYNEKCSALHARKETLKWYSDNKIQQRVYCCSVSQSCLTLCDLMDCGMPGFQSFTVSQSLLTFMFIELVMLSDHLILCHPHSPFVFSLSQHQGLFQCVRWPKYWSSASASVLPMNIQD